MPRVHLVDLPALKLLDTEGFNWTAFRRLDPRGGQQILAAHLEAGGFEVEIINLKKGESETDLGKTVWRDRPLTKIAVGTPWRELDPRDADVWGITVNYLQERDVCREIIEWLVTGGGKVVVGGSDAFAEPEFYLAAGAAAVILDKSGAANLPVLDHVLGREPRRPLFGVALPGQKTPAIRGTPMRPQDWPLPGPRVVRETLGTTYWEAPLGKSLSPIGAVMLDLGCDRKCDFCETPSYRLGYRAMTPARCGEWLQAQRDAGAKSVIVLSDQFLARVLWEDGRREVMEITREFRRLGLAILWGNGLELSKVTVGRGRRDGDQTPDEELVQALWGWDGKIGCAQTYIPAERPITGTESYEKLLPWEQHFRMMKMVVHAGVPDITYGVIVGLPEDSREDLQRLIVVVGRLRAELKSINPALKFRVVPYAIRPLPGTPQAETLHKLGLIRFSDPAVVGGFWTACADTFHMTYEEVSDWQHRLMSELSDNEPGFQGLTAINR